MKSYRIIPQILLAVVFSSIAVYGENENFFSGNSASQNKFVLDGGKIYREEKSLHELPVEGNVLGIYSNDDSLYFIKQTEEGWLAGICKIPEEDISEYLIGTGFSGLLKLISYDNIFYFLADFISKEKSDNADDSAALPGKVERVFVRFDPDNNEKKVITGVEDFIMAGSRVILLTSGGLDCNGFIIPLSLTGQRYIDRIIDNRFVFLTNGSEVEVIDIISERNIYYYRDGKAFPVSEDHNIILEFNDTSVNSENTAPDENMNYYQVDINGFESGRTETAPKNVLKSIKLKAETGKYSFVKAERWELDKTKGRYVRVNNIYQPEEIKLFIPDNRIIKIRFDFDGEKYILNQSVYEN